jgi:hypothetical protein
MAKIAEICDHYIDPRVPELPFFLFEAFREKKLRDTFLTAWFSWAQYTQAGKRKREKSFEYKKTDSFQGCQIFPWYNTYTKSGKNTKWAQNISAGHKIHQMSIKYTNIFLCKTLTKFTQIAIFGRKTHHLATLLFSSISSSVHPSKNSCG